MLKESIRFVCVTAGLVMLMAVSACGQSKSDRALSGAGLGAGAGAVAGALTGGSAVNGAVIGGALGAAGGALTDQNDVDLGKPAWRR